MPAPARRSDWIFTRGKSQSSDPKPCLIVNLLPLPARVIFVFVNIGAELRYSDRLTVPACLLHNSLVILPGRTLAIAASTPCLDAFKTSGGSQPPAKG
jgi:hypothetical protein